MRYMLAISVAAALLAGCGALQTSTGALRVTPQIPEVAAARIGMRRSTSSSYRVVHRFGDAHHNGGVPEGSLIYVNGKLYGTTLIGGGTGCFYGTRGAPGGCGTVFQMDPTSGAKKVLYSFRGSSDGANPVGNLVAVNGTLYGVTEHGGGGCGVGCGTVYSVSTTGKETVLHTFDNESDGNSPAAGLIDVNGTLYGTTMEGGSGGCFITCGTVYSITTSGTENVLFSFNGHDGAYPVSSLLNVKGILYGTTSSGGPSGYGTVYRITTTGTEKVLHRFGGSPDGATPGSGLVDAHGTLYGTTSSGGDKLCYEVSYTCGIVYSITTTGKEKVLYTFSPASGDGAGAHPTAGLVNVNGVLYGTTPIGGNGACGSGCGVVYSLTTTGVEAVVHSFNGGSDGARADTTMIDIKGTLYGTTPEGGGSKCFGHVGCGTVFALTP